MEGCFYSLAAGAHLKQSLDLRLVLLGGGEDRRIILEKAQFSSDVESN